MDIIIREETIKDHQKIFDVNKEAFKQDDESRLVERIRAGESFMPELSLVAEVDETLVGHILFSKIKILGDQHTEFHTLSLAPLAVLPAYQGNGIGGLLVTKGLLVAKGLSVTNGLGFSSVIVLGHKDYYPGFGFRKASEWHITCPFEVPDEAFMAIELVEGALAGKVGIVEYPKEFDGI
ncbi:MAG: N-acetyltransferase [Bacteroidetes bacterium]|nr:N-acetyltransferase [Bacteroidota bacterium]